MNFVSAEPMVSTTRPHDQLKQLLAGKQPEFFELLRQQTLAAISFPELVRLSTLRKRAAQRGFEPDSRARPLRLAMIGGCSLYPLQDLMQHCLEAAGSPTGRKVELFTGAYDNYVA